MKKTAILGLILVLSICSVLALSSNNERIEKELPNDAYLMKVCGNVNGDSNIDSSDLSYLIKYLFQNGDKPECDPITACADVNVDRRVNVADVVYMINFLYKKGKEPCYKLTHRVSPNSARFKPIADPTKVVHMYSKIPRSIARYL